MATITVEAEVDLDEIETYELVDEVCRRISNAGRKGLTDKHKSEIREELKNISNILLYNVEIIEVRSLDDKMKYEHLSKVWNKYTSFEIEKLLP